MFIVCRTHTQICQNFFIVSHAIMTADAHATQFVQFWSRKFNFKWHMWFEIELCCVLSRRAVEYLNTFTKFQTTSRTSFHKRHECAFPNPISVPPEANSRNVTLTRVQFVSNYMPMSNANANVYVQVKHNLLFNHARTTSLPFDKRSVRESRINKRARERERKLGKIIPLTATLVKPLMKSE
jgi:hypothetical protein